MIFHLHIRKMHKKITANPFVTTTGACLGSHVFNMTRLTRLAKDVFELFRVLLVVFSVTAPFLFLTEDFEFSCMYLDILV